MVSSIAKQSLCKGVFVTPPALMAISPIAFFDNAWAVARNKAETAGVVLAQLLLSRPAPRPLSVVA